MKGLSSRIGVLTLALMAGAYARDGLAQEKKPNPRTELEAEIVKLRSALAE